MPEHFLENNVINALKAGENKGTILRAMATFTAIELCGSFLTGRIGQGNTKPNFMAFCQSNYMPAKYHAIAELLYKIFRCGVHHSYLAKGAALLSSQEDSIVLHLEFTDQGLWVYVPQLAEDVTQAIKELMVDLRKDPALKANHDNVLRDIQQEGKQIYQKFITDRNISTKSITVQGDMYTGL